MRRFAAAPLVGSRVQIPCVCCVMCTQQPLRRADHSLRGAYRERACVCVCVCELFTSRIKRPRHDLGCVATEKNLHISFYVVRDSVVGIATRYGLEGPGIEFRWGRDFSQPSRPTLGPTQPPIRWVTGLFSGGKAAGAWS
jgi:hypothetical protein